MSNAKAVSAPAPVAAAPAHPVKAAVYAESATITVLKLAGKRGASAARFAAYGPVGNKITVGAYLDACLALQPDEPRYRWRADLAWDAKRGFISVA
jgi:hypothetical protein